MTVSEALTSTYVQSGFSFEVSHTHRLEGSESLIWPLSGSESIEESIVKVEMLSPEDAKKARKKVSNDKRAANPENVAADNARRRAKRAANPEKVAAYNAKATTKRAEARERQRAETEEQRLASSPAVSEYIAERVEVVEDGGCWEWQKGLIGTGYGQAKLDGLNWPAHRLSYHYIVGRIPNGAQVHHRCANRLCCNPDHLQVTTQHDNTAEMMGRRFLEDEIGRLSMENDNLRQANEDLRQANDDLRSEVDYLASSEDL